MPATNKTEKSKGKEKIDPQDNFDDIHTDTGKNNTAHFDVTQHDFSPFAPYDSSQSPHQSWDNSSSAVPDSQQIQSAATNTYRRTLHPVSQTGTPYYMGTPSTDTRWVTSSNYASIPPVHSYPSWGPPPPPRISYSRAWYPTPPPPLKSSYESSQGPSSSHTFRKWGNPAPVEVAVTHSDDTAGFVADDNDDAGHSFDAYYKAQGDTVGSSFSGVADQQPIVATGDNRPRVSLQDLTNRMGDYSIEDGERKETEAEQQYFLSNADRVNRVGAWIADSSQSRTIQEQEGHDVLPEQDQHESATYGPVATTSIVDRRGIFFTREAGQPSDKALASYDNKKAKILSDIETKLATLKDEYIKNLTKEMKKSSKRSRGKLLSALNNHYQDYQELAQGYLLGKGSELRKAAEKVGIHPAQVQPYTSTNTENGGLIRLAGKPGINDDGDLILTSKQRQQGS